jgi:hypothetical protein
MICHNKSEVRVCFGDHPSHIACNNNMEHFYAPLLDARIGVPRLASKSPAICVVGYQEQLAHDTNLGKKGAGDWLFLRG